MRKIKNWMKDVWFNNVIMPYLLKHKPQCTLALRDAFVYQMWSAGVKFTHINKWLFKVKAPTIKGYVMNNGNPHLFYELPTGERLKDITSIHGPIIMIS